MLLVLWMHACYAGYLAAPLWFPYSGRLGVSLFFVLSGYLITTLLLAERERAGRLSLKRFYLRRGLRIFPPFYAYLLFLVVATRFGLPATDPTGLALAACYCLNLTSRYRDHNIEHTWSLAYEEQYYLAWPWLLTLLGPGGSTWLAAATAFGWPLLRVMKAGTLEFDSDLMLQSTAFDTLMMGSCLALLSARLPERLQKFRARTWTLLLAVGFLLGQFAFHSSWPGFLTCLIPTTRDLALCWIVWWCAGNPGSFLVRVLEYPLLRMLGLLSYSIYLWHPAFLRRGDGLVAWGWQSWMALAVAASLSYLLLERPLAGLRKRLRA